ncbi:translation initiation factor IF-2-like [Vulpes lagopus]|uniref:translation initiation factor IF-2-like n=1 Tax=Vulpes lagopus TaxID=494514 RepID=UPI001BC9DE74|nr:translation initiation factor IF-2-like [Vulpes lagopus]
MADAPSACAYRSSRSPRPAPPPRRPRPLPAPAPAPRPRRRPAGQARRGPAADPLSSPAPRARGARGPGAREARAELGRRGGGALWPRVPLTRCAARAPGAPVQGARGSPGSAAARRGRGVGAAQRALPGAPGCRARGVQAAPSPGGPRGARPPGRVRVGAAQRAPREPRVAGRAARSPGGPRGARPPGRGPLWPRVPLTGCAASAPGSPGAGRAGCARGARGPGRWGCRPQLCTDDGTHTHGVGFCGASRARLRGGGVKTRVCITLCKVTFARESPRLPGWKTASWRPLPGRGPPWGALGGPADEQAAGGPRGAEREKPGLPLNTLILAFLTQKTLYCPVQIHLSLSSRASLAQDALEGAHITRDRDSSVLFFLFSFFLKINIVEKHFLPRIHCSRLLDFTQ